MRTIEREIKFRYRFDRGEKFKNVISGCGERFITEIVTLEELENGNFESYYSNYKILSRDRYIGEKDKKGKEIYEGDIIKKQVDIKYEQEQIGFDAKKVLTYRNYLIEIKTPLEYYEKPLEKVPCYYEIGSQEVEVIGSIYENKDLL